jgi:DHA1 family multidrug resistance protein-like MFS transporter
VLAISGFQLSLPFLPYYVQELGITAEGKIAFWAGLVISSQAVTMALIAPVWGSLADRYGRKIMVVRAMLGGAVVLTLMGLVRNVYQLVLLRTIQGLLTGTVPAATTLVASSAPPDRRGTAIGILRVAVYLGSSTGPLMGGLIADRLSMRAAFYITGGLLFLAGVLVSILVQEQFQPPAKEQAEDAQKPRLWDGVLLALRTPAILSIFSVRVTMQTAFRMIAIVLPLYIQAIASPEIRVASFTGLIMGLASATSAGAAVVLGRLSDRFGSRRILLVCGAAACVLYALMAGVQTLTQLLIVRVIAGAALGGILASVSVLLADLVPQNRFGAVYGVDTSMMALANALGPMLGAAVAANWGLSSAFIGAAAMYGLATGVVGILVPGPSQSSGSQHSGA